MYTPASGAIEQYQPVLHVTISVHNNAKTDPNGNINIESFWDYASHNDANLRQIRSAMHTAISVAPNIDRIIEETKRSFFTNKIALARLREVGKLRFLEYNGSTDP